MLKKCCSWSCALAPRGSRYLVAASFAAISAASAQCPPDWITGQPLVSFDACISITEIDPDGPGPLPKSIYFGGGMLADNSRQPLVSATRDLDCDSVVIASADLRTGIEIGNATFDGPVYAVISYHDSTFCFGDYLKVNSQSAAGAAKLVNGAWQSIISPGLGGRAAVSFNDELFVGGVATVGGSTLARYSGTTFQPFGNVTGLVTSLLVHDGQLIVSGDITSAGGLACSRIAATDGQTWQTLGSGFNARVNATASFRSRLIAAGAFSKSGATDISRIAQWNGATWEPLGAGLNGTVRSIAVWRDQLWVAGEFTEAGGTPAPGLAAWDGASWRAFTGLPSTRTWPLLATDSRLVVSSRAYMDDAGLHTIGAPQNGHAPVRAIHSFAGETYVSICPTNSSVESPTAAVYRRTPTGLERLGGFFNKRIDCLFDYDGELLAGGWFWEYDHQPIFSGSVPVFGLVRWDGTTWQPFPLTFSSPPPLLPYLPKIKTAAKFLDQLIVGGLGAFRNPSGAVWVWNGSIWTQLGQFTDCNDMLVHQGKLYMAASFGQEGRVVSWDGSVLETIDDEAFVPSSNARTYSLTVFDGDVVVGGQFKLTRNPGTWNLARLRSGLWEPMGSTPKFDTARRVIAHDQNLYAFARVSTPSSSIYRWNGADWDAVPDTNFFKGLGTFDSPGTELDDRHVVLSRAGELVVGGSFLSLGRRASPYFAVFSPSDIPAITNQPSDSAACRSQASFTLTVTSAGSTSYQWRRGTSPLSDGPQPNGSFLSGAYTPTLTITGARPSDAGQYTCTITNSCGTVTSDPATLTVCPSDFNCDGFSDAADLDAFLNAFFTANPDSDINGDGFLDALDYDRFTADFVVGC